MQQSARDQVMTDLDTATAARQEQKTLFSMRAYRDLVIDGKAE